MKYTNLQARAPALFSIVSNQVDELPFDFSTSISFEFCGKHPIHSWNKRGKLPLVKDGPKENKSFKIERRFDDLNNDKLSQRNGIKLDMYMKCIWAYKH